MSLGTVVFCMFLVTCSPFYSENCFKVSLLLCALLCSLSLAVYLQISPTPDEIISEVDSILESLPNVSTSTLGQTDLSEAGLFALYVEVSKKEKWIKRKIDRKIKFIGFTLDIYCDTLASLWDSPCWAVVHPPVRNHCWHAPTF